MAYINKENEVSVCESLQLGYIKNKDGKTANPSLYLHAKINLTSNEVSDVSYSVQCYNNVDIFGYHRSEHDNYNDAKEAYDRLFDNNIKE
jgi:hypothetical protein